MSTHTPHPAPDAKTNPSTSTNAPPTDPNAEVARPELTDEARRAEEREKQGKPVRNATREPSSVALDRAADEGMIPGKDE